MSSQAFRLGVPTVEISSPNGFTVPSLHSVTPTITALTNTQFTYLNNDVRQQLPAGDYNVLVGFVGQDLVNGGYTVANTTSVPESAVTVASGGAINVNIAAGDLPTHFDSSSFAMLFINPAASSLYYPCDLAYVDPSGVDFNFLITNLPMPGVVGFTSTLLDSATTNSILGSRSPGGVSYAPMPTTGGVDIVRDVVNIPIAPDISANINVASVRSPSVRFQALANDMETFVNAVAGIYKAWTVNGYVYKQASMSLATALGIVRNNATLKLIMPPNNNGQFETRLYAGLLTFNQIQITEAWRKDAYTPVQFQFDTAIIDKLLINQHAEIVYELDAT